MKKYAVIISIVMGLSGSIVASYLTSVDFDKARINKSIKIPGNEGVIQHNNAAIPKEKTLYLSAPITGSMLYLCMIFGIILGQLFQEVTSKPEKEVSLRELLKTLNKGKSWGAFLASPIVFFSTASSLIEVGVSTISIYYALQNGFFCLTIFNGISKKIGQSPVTES